jgi:hypothetical protein
MKRTFLLCSAALALLAVIVSGPARAAPDVYVSGSGLDAQPCTRGAPCLTFSHAVTVVDPGGTVFCLDKVTQTGTLTIAQSVEINCADVGGEIIAPSGGHGVDIATAGIVVSLRGIDVLGLQAGGIGVNFTDGNVLSMSHSRVLGFKGTGGGPGVGVLFAPSTGTGVFDVHDCAFNGNGLASSGGGVILQPSGSANVRAVIDYSRVSRNTFGVFANANGTTGSVSTSVNNSVVEHSSQAGISSFTLGNGIASTVVNGTMASLNGGSGILAQGNGAFVTLAHSTVTSNATGLNASGGTIFSYGDNHLLGNITNGPNPSPLPLK